MIMINTNDQKPSVKPKKRLGQNFLNQIGVIKKLIAAAELGDNQTILEIGPGTGNLTRELAKTGNRVIAVEKDRELAAILGKEFADAINVEIINADALKFNESKIIPPYKIVANLPFYAAAPMIRKFLESGNPPRSMAVIAQKEVAQRICAQPPRMNLLALSVQFYAAPNIIGQISRGCFWPVPKVDSAILRLDLFPKAGEGCKKEFIDRFFKIAKAGFAHPRKQLAGNLAGGLNISRERAIEWLAKNDLPRNCRAQDLAVENWIGLARSFEL